MFNYNANPNQIESCDVESGMPVDTVIIMFHTDPSKLCLDSDWKHNKSDGKNQYGLDIVFQDEYIRNFKSANGTRVGLTYCSFDKYHKLGTDLLFIEFSLPKLLYGCNHHIIDMGWDDALDEISFQLAIIRGFPILEIRQGILFRLDICLNFQVGNNVKDYIQALHHGNYPKREMCFFRNKTGGVTGVMFKTGSSGISITFYDKGKECKHNEADGVLRAEVSMRKKARIEEKLRKTNITLQDITREDLISIILFDLQILSLDKPIICDRLEIEARLSKIYKPQRVRTLLGFLMELRTKTEEQIREGGTGRSTISRYKKWLREANISSISYDGKKSLPPLI
jgi:hypothetical protein